MTPGQELSDEPVCGCMMRRLTATDGLATYSEPQERKMNRKKTSGLVGIIVGGVWLVNNFKHFEEQGIVAIGMPETK